MTDATVFLVDDDPAVRDALALLLGTAGLAVETYASAEEFLHAYRPEQAGCLVLDVTMPGMSGLDLQAELAARGVRLPIIFLTAHGSIPMSVRALKSGAVDFLEKPADGAALVDRVRAALDRDAASRVQDASAAEITARFARLTAREREIMARVAAGRSNKEIARELDISHRTVEVHRARVLEKMNARSAVELAAMAKICGLDTDFPPKRSDV